MAETISSGTSGEIPLSESMYTKKGVDELIAQTVKGGVTPKGSVAFANLPSPGSTNVGWMYNVTDAFTTTSAFVEGEGKKFPAGTNVYVVNPSSNTYKWDVLPGEGPQPGTSTPNADGTGSAGSSANYAREDHTHPTDGTRQAKITASGILKGDGAGGVSAATAGTDYVKSLSQASAGVVTVTGSGGVLTVDHATKGPSSSGNTSKGDTTAQTPTFGGTFKALSATVDKYGHVTALAEHNVTVPALPTASTSAAGVVQLSSSTTGTSETKAATEAAVKAAKDAADSAASAASGVGTRVAAIETAAATLYTALAGLDATSMTTANAIKTLVSSILSYLKAFAAASDNDGTTTYTAS